MMAKFFDLVNKYYIFFLLVIVLISYGQILFMQPWQDDNALFFKLAHINEPAGFLGRGVLGTESPYKYVATPYFFIYKLFGFSTKAYFGFALICYFGACLSLYFLFRELVNKFTGMVAGLLFAVNYPTSDSFIRLFNSVSMSLGIIFFSLLFIFYSKFFKHKKIIYYMFSIIFYFLILEVALIRSYAIIFVVIIFDFLYTFKKSRISTFFWSSIAFFLRITPFLLIFHWVYSRYSDSRSSGIINIFWEVINGKFENFISLFSGIGYLVIPDVVAQILPNTIKISLSPYYKVLVLNLLILIIFNLVVIYLLRVSKLTFIFIFISSFWFLISKLLYQTLTTTQSFNLIFIEFIGGIIILSLSLFFLLVKLDKNKIFLVFFSLILLNTLGYIFYDPTVFFGTYNSRYLVYSFVGLVGCFALIANRAYHRKKTLILILLFVWGLTNLLLNVFNQKNILVERSFPINNFYDHLKTEVPQLQKGAILYFDVKDQATIQQRFSNAINSSQMPQTTAIAWRYNLDRYDFLMVDSYSKLIEQIKSDSIPLNKVYTFWYFEEGLLSTTKDLKKLLTQEINLSNTVKNLPLISKTKLTKSVDSTNFIQPELELNFVPPLISLVPTQLTLKVEANSLQYADILYPLKNLETKEASSLDKDRDLSKLAISYKKYKESFRDTVQIKTTSVWQDNISSNLADGDFETLWRPDRVLWSQEKASIILDLKTSQEINRVVWANGYGDQTPTLMKILTSEDGSSFSEVANISQKERIDPKQLQIIEFKPSFARFIKIELRGSLNDDAPAISELWVVPSEFSKLNIKETEDFLKQPFRFIPSSLSFSETLNSLNLIGTAKISWLGDKKEGFQSGDNAKINLIYDGKIRDYTISLPAGGTKISKLILSEFSIPGDINLSEIRVIYPKPIF